MLLYTQLEKHTATFQRIAKFWSSHYLHWAKEISLLTYSHMIDKQTKPLQIFTIYSLNIPEYFYLFTFDQILLTIANSV